MNETLCKWHARFYPKAHPVSREHFGYKAGIDRMTEEERFFAAAYLQRLAQENDPAYQAMLGERMKRMDAGH